MGNEVQETMKILCRCSDKSLKPFKVIRGLFYEKRDCKAGETIELKSDDPITTHFFKIGRIIPLDIPEVGEYISLKSLTLPGNELSFTCGPLEVIELLRDQAVKLMISGAVIPRDDHQWRPSNRRLRELNPNKRSMVR